MTLLVLLDLKIFAACDDLWGGPLVRGRRPRRPGFGCGYAALWGGQSWLRAGLPAGLSPLESGLAGSKARPTWHQNHCQVLGRTVLRLFLRGSRSRSSRRWLGGARRGSRGLRRCGSRRSRSRSRITTKAPLICVKTPLEFNAASRATSLSRCGVVSCPSKRIAVLRHLTTGEQYDEPPLCPLAAA